MVSGGGNIACISHDPKLDPHDHLSAFKADKRWSSKGNGEEMATLFFHHLTLINLRGAGVVIRLEEDTVGGTFVRWSVLRFPPPGVYFLALDPRGGR